MVDFIEQLNRVQKDAVTNVKGPSLVIAGAGSGKTRVLTFRIAYLLSRGVPPYKILALTFTNKAAREMKDRISRLIDSKLANQLWMGTFHSVFSKILRFEAENLNYSSNFTIYDTEDSRSLIKKIIKDLNLDDQTYKANDIQSRISMAKNNLITSKAYVSNNAILTNDKSTNKPMIGDIYRNYDLRCRKADAMDFDDLLLNTNVLFRDFPNVLEKYQDRFDYVLVDEYQDTNFSQYLIVTKLVAKHKNLCVVGDDAQSIYSFRGAKIENILNFRKDFPDYNIYKLEQNYRSTQTIVNAANSIINKNREQIKKDVYSKNEEGEKIKVFKAFTDSEEGVKIAADIVDRKYQQQLEHKDFAILYRTNAQSRIFEESLRRKNIPYRIYGSISFYQRKEIKDILAYYRLIINNKDDVALKRIINYPARGIGQTTINRLEEISVALNVSIWEVLRNSKVIKERFNAGTVTKLLNFRNLIDEFIPLLETKDAYELAQEVATKAGIIHDLSNESGTEARSRYENIEELLNGIKEFVDNQIELGEPLGLGNFMENVALLTDADTNDEEGKDTVSLMTIHAAKGLEFKVVYVAGLEEELFPSRLSVQSAKDLEEERRLFYVAITRAEKSAVLSYAETRYKWGGPNNCTPSRFISEIDETYLDQPMFLDDFSVTETQKPLRDIPKFKQKAQKPLVNNPHLNKVKQNLKKINDAKSQPQAMPKDFKPDNPSEIQIGMKVKHIRFGEGKVTHLEGADSNKKATVFFTDLQQEKTLLLNFAKLMVVRTV